ncbi:MAG: TonB-dependent hemoglobin/transferrin/lactoferrin family receptor [Thermoanaerobaculia bacterium]
MRRAAPAFLLLLLSTTGFTSAQTSGPDAAAGAATVAADPETKASTDDSFLDAITVTATSTPQSIEDTAGSVGVISQQQIEETQAADVRDLLLFEPGVYAEGSPARLGLGGFNIRGIGGNRVQTRVDGVPVAEQFAFGPLAIQRSSIDVDALQSVEILRSAGSSLYGSDALGGVVSLMTRDPGDYLNGNTSYAGGRLGYNGAAKQSVGAATVAGSAGRWSGSLAATYRDGDATGNQGENDSTTSLRTTPNPLDRQSTEIFGKVLFDVSDSWRLRLGAESFSTRSSGEVFTSRTLQDLGSAFGPGVIFQIATEDFDAEDKSDRRRFSLDSYTTFTAPFLNSLVARGYFYDTRTDQDVVELVRTTMGGGPFGPLRSSAASRDGLFRFDQDGFGAELQGKAAADTGSTKHLFTYGASVDHTNFDQLRNRIDTNPVTGAVLTSTFAFPTKYFPESDVDELGVYVQDEIALASGRVTLVPGVRYDSAKLDADQNDPIYLSGNPGIAIPEDAEHHAFSPRLGAVVGLTARWNAFAQYSHGFRTPPYSDVNSGFTNLQSGYTALPNPDLDPETSDNYELGVRGLFARGGLSVTIFDNQFKDFIELVAIGENEATGLLEFQSLNVGKVRVRGIEVSADARLAHDLSLRGAASFIDGDNETADAPLNSVPPSRVVVGLNWRPEGAFRAGLVTSYLFEKRDAEIDNGSVDQFATPDAFVIDATVSYAINKHFSLEAGLFNLLDEKYWEWGDVQGVSASSSVLDRYTSPGRNVSAALRLNW